MAWYVYSCHDRPQQDQSQFMRRSLRTQVQRLDRNTSGAMMVCRTSKAAARISEQLRERHVEKVYLAGT